MFTLAVSPRLTRPGAIATVAGLALVLVPAMSVMSTAGAALQAGCAQATPGANVVCTYTDSTAEHQFVVPTGVTTVSVELIGGKGGDGTGNTTGPIAGGVGGTGAKVTGSLTVTPAQTLFVNVGGNGATGGNGGANGGGNSGTVTSTGNDLGGGGGGASDIRTTSGNLASRVAVAGGGGGAGGRVNGGAAGADGTGAGVSPDAVSNGKAGTALLGGAAGVAIGSPGGTAATAGTAGNGGDGITTTPLPPTGHVGGGGGGGLFGGGGGSATDNPSVLGAGGGGGSSLVPAGGAVAATTDAPSVKITYAPGVATALTFAMTSPIAVGTSDPITAITETDTNGATVTPTSLAFTLDPADAGTCDSTPGSEACTFTKVGNVKVTGTDTLVGGSITSDLTITVTAGPALTLTIAPLDPTAAPAEAVPFTATGKDVGDNLFDATSASTFTIVPKTGGAAAGATCTANVCSAEVPGVYTVTATDGNVSAATDLTVTAPSTSPTPTPTPTPSGSTTTPGGTNNNGGKGPLANTGTAVENGVRYALALLALGAAVVAFARRRQLRVAHPFVQRPRANPSIGFRLPPHTH